MVEYGGNRYPTLCPYIYCADSGAALEWLTRAFGSVERIRSTDDEGNLRHCEMSVGDSLIMVGGRPAMGLRWIRSPSACTCSSKTSTRITTAQLVPERVCRVRRRIWSTASGTTGSSTLTATSGGPPRRWSIESGAR